MFHRKCPALISYLVPLAFLTVLSDCVDPVPPEFAYKEGLIYIDALLSTTPGTSSVKIAISKREFGLNRSPFVPGASVRFYNSDSGDEVYLYEDNELYIPDPHFAAEVGQTWELLIVMADGTTYRSEKETIRAPVAITDIRAEYDTQLRLSDDNKNIPGHRILVNFIDPGGEDNYYFWQFRSFEALEFCRMCVFSNFRNGECVTPPLPTAILDYYTYGCEERCWQLRYSDNIAIFSDEYSNGSPVTSLPIAEVPLYTKRNIVVQVQQFSLTQQAYRYYKILKDLIDNNTGFNAPLPAALVGNLYNPDDPDEFVLGRFTAAPTAVSPVFIERIHILDNQLEFKVISQAEGLEVPPPIITTAPCEESRFRTSQKPDGWID